MDTLKVIMKSYLPLLILIPCLAASIIPVMVLAGPASTNFELKSYSFGAGGDSASSANYKAFMTLGEQSAASLSSQTFNIGSGLTYTINADVPPAPTVTNAGTNYDRLKVVINQGQNATDATYALSISSDNFVSDIRYIKSDATIGSTLATSDFQSYATWGGATGFSVTGLARNTTYKIRVKARKGSINYQETQWGPTSTGVATSDPTLTFSVSANAVTFNNLNTGNSFTDNSQTTVLTTSTNAYNGYVVNARETGPLTHTVDGTTTISDYGSANSAPSTWSGNGFGYTTSDNDLTGGTNTRFTSGTKYAAFTTSSPGDPVADHAGPITTAISNESFTITYRITSASSQKAGKYTTTVLYNVVPQY
ncbi:hypothetical protein BH09PAT1_BH09PAT1_6270 [soil metagenome]